MDQELRKHTHTMCRFKSVENLIWLKSPMESWFFVERVFIEGYWRDSASNDQDLLCLWVWPYRAVIAYKIIGITCKQKYIIHLIQSTYYLYFYFYSNIYQTH